MQSHFNRETSSCASITGAFVQALTFLKGTSEDMTYHNPHFRGTPDMPRGYSIYCIHGTADRSASFLKVTKHLLEETIVDGVITNRLPETVATIRLLAFEGRGRGNDINFFARQVIEKAAANQDTDIISFDHSRGGLVAAEVDSLAKKAGINIHAILTLCTPFGGSGLATKPLSKISDSVKQMEKGSHYLDTVQEVVAETNRLTKKYFYFAATKDSIVDPNDAFIKENCHSIIIMKNHGHLSILRSRKLIDYIEAILATVVKRPRASALSEQQEEKSAAPVADKNIMTVYQEIDAEIAALEQRTHCFSTSEKEMVLTKLKTCFGNMLFGLRDEDFPEASSVGHFIELFMSKPDEKTEKTARDILKQQLNFPFSLFKSTRPTTEGFIEKLIRRYRDVPLHVDAEVTRQLMSSAEYSQAAGSSSVNSSSSQTLVQPLLQNQESEITGRITRKM